MNQFALGKRIREARKAKGLTSERLAALCSVNPVHIRKIESGAKSPSIALFIKLCNALDVSSAYLLQDYIMSDSVNLDGTLDKTVNNLPDYQEQYLRGLVDLTLRFFSELDGCDNKPD